MGHQGGYLLLGLLVGEGAVDDDGRELFVDLQHVVLHLSGLDAVGHVAGKRHEFEQALVDVEAGGNGIELVVDVGDELHLSVCVGCLCLGYLVADGIEV